MIWRVTRDWGDVVVLGAGLAGLSASLAFARSGRRVFLLERDRPGVAGDADRLFECWDRPGIAHFRQPHNFLAAGREVLLDRAPDVLNGILALGARENRQYQLLPAEAQEGDKRLVSICARRPLLEYAFRRAVEAEDNVMLATSARAVGLLADSGRSGGPVRVGGVRTHDGGEIRAGLVVDALGRTSPAASWLTALGARPMPMRRSECGLLYYSRHFRLHDGVEIPPSPFLLGGPRGEIGYLAFAVFVEDNRTFALILSIPPWDRELRALKSEHAYMTAALSLPAVAPWVHPDQAEPITPVLPMGRKPAEPAPLARRRRRARRRGHSAGRRCALPHQPNLRLRRRALGPARLHARRHSRPHGGSPRAGARLRRRSRRGRRCPL
jgi:2-polyprenyl-6-methoxyphenol hydroxylase-like FAD-dependent oxidoreductase